MLHRWYIGLMLAGIMLSLGCANEAGKKGKTAVGTGGPKELEPRPIVPSAEDVVSIRIQADEGFLGGPFDETIAEMPLTAEILKIVSIVQTGPRQIGDVAKHGRKGKLSIRTKQGPALDFVLTDHLAIHFVSAYSINTAALEAIVSKHRAEKK